MCPRLPFYRLVRHSASAATCRNVYLGRKLMHPKCLYHLGKSDNSTMKFDLPSVSIQWVVEYDFKARSERRHN